MKKFRRFGFLGAVVAVPCLLTLGASGVAYAQPALQPAAKENVQSQRLAMASAKRDKGYTYLNCDGIAECLISETPVHGVRMVRPKDYSRRPAYYLSANLYTTLAGGRETDNRFVAFDFLIEPEGGPLPHTHRNEWESFFVSDGTVTFIDLMSQMEYDYLDANPLTVLYGPQGPVHGFRNFRKGRAHIFSFAMPAGLDAFFQNAGQAVEDFNAPIPPITREEIARTAFWAEQRGDALWFLGAPPPQLFPGTPQMVLSSATDSKRPTETGPWGERRVILLTPQEVGNTTGATAFCGPGRPGRPGGSVKYSYINLATQRTDFPSSYTSQNTEVFYTLGGNLSLSFGAFLGKTVTVEPGTFIQIEPGVPFSIGNISVSGQASTAASTLAISVLPPPVCQ